jgi:hypothetical protein
MSAREEQMMTGSVRLQLGAAFAALALVSGFVVQTSSAAFSGTTSNSGNSFSAGTVSLTDDDAAAAMFSLTNLKPGSTSTKCIELTYTGSLATAIKLYGAIGAGTGLGAYIDLTVESGTPGTFADCSTFAGTQIYSGTLANFASTYTNWASGLSDANWTPSTNGQTRAYRFVVTLQDNNAAQGLTATSTTFTWEAQNT